MSDSDDPDGYDFGWDGGAIDGTDQWISEAPYWGDGEVVGPDREAADDDGDVTTVGTDGDGDEDDGSGDEWPPSFDDIDDIRQRLLDGESAVEVAEDYPRGQATINAIAKGDYHHQSGERADTPALEYQGPARYGGWVIADDSDSDNDTGEWPPTPDDIDDIRQRLLDGESAVEVAEDYPRGHAVINAIAKGERYLQLGERADTPALEYEGATWDGEWVIADDSDSDNDTGEWPPTPDDIDDIRQRLLDGESRREVAEDYPAGDTTISRTARGEWHQNLGELADTPPLQHEGEPGHGEWAIADDVDDTDNDDPSGSDGETDSAADDGEQYMPESPYWDDNEPGADPAPAPTAPSPPPSARGDGISDTVIAAVVLVVGFLAAYLLGRLGGDE